MHKGVGESSGLDSTRVWSPVPTPGDCQLSGTPLLETPNTLASFACTHVHKPTYRYIRTTTMMTTKIEITIYHLKLICTS